jgi:hypothetical protein
MPAPIVIELTPQAQAVIVKLRNFPQEMGQAIKRGMDDAGNTAWREITIQRFRGLGKKPYPVEEHRLRNISDRLQTSLFWRNAKVETAGNSVSVTGTMGSEGVWYFPLHEYGGTITIKPFFRKNRKSSKKNPKPQIAVKSHTRTYPERAPMRTGIAEHKILFQQKIQAELEKTLAAKGPYQP